MIKRKTNGSSCVIVKLIHKPHRKDNAFAMNTVTQTMKFRQSLLSYAEKHEVTQAAIKYNVNPPSKKAYCYFTLPRSHPRRSSPSRHRAFSAKGGTSISFLKIVLHSFAQNNDLVRIFRSIFFALVDKLRTKS